MSLMTELVSFLEGLSEPHILFDRQYRIVAANAAYRRLYSPANSVIGRTCYDVSHRISVPCDQAGESCPLTRALVSGQRERVLHVHHTPQGEAYVSIELHPLRNAEGELAYFIERIEPVRAAPGGSKMAVPLGLVGRSAPFQRMLQRITRVAPSEATVLLQGESGTGKELVARAVHESSRRSHKPLVVVDCTSLPEQLFESELFGHERGSFTGATHQKQGLVEAASGGTLFLDEVGEIPLPMQVKLLRLLESGTYRRVGATDWRHADIRVVSATHRDLRAMVTAGQFREDLYFRLSTFPVHLPPLRERLDDLPLLVPALLARIAGERPMSLSETAMARLAAHPFPGNVRELRNLLERISLLCDGHTAEAGHVEEAIDPDCAQPVPACAVSSGTVMAQPMASASFSGSMFLLELDALRVAVRAHQGSRSELARKLGMSERTLYRRLKQIESGS